MDVPLVKPVVLIAYLFLILSGLLIPSSGSHGALHPKSFAFISVCFFLTSYFIFFKRAITETQYALFFSSLLFIAFCLIWLIVGLLHPRLEAVFPFDQFKLLLITFVVVVASLLLYLDKTLTFSLFLKTLLYGNCFYVFFKIAAAFALLFKIVTFDKLTDFLGIRAVGMAVFGDFQRVQTSMDISTPFLIFFCLESERFGVKIPKVFKWAFPIFGMISTVISFSRVLIFIAGVSFVLYFCLHNVKHFIRGLMLGLIALTAAFALIGPNNAMKMVEMRLFSKENSKSDVIRSNQIEALFEEIGQNPLLGMGLGGYSEKEIRDTDIKHSYEVQWVALLSQLGFLGLFCFLIPFFYLTAQMLYPPWTREKMALLILWCGWISSGFTNPFVISLTSGIIYSLFALSVLKLKEASIAKV